MKQDVMPKRMLKNKYHYRIQNLRWLFLAAVLVAIDQTSKYFASKYLILGLPHPVLPFFNLTLLHNKGAAFSLLEHAGGWQFWLFVLVAITATIILVHWLWILQKHQATLAIAINFLLAGALGNLIDRVFHGYVIDFLQLYYRHWSWPVFNVADVCVDIGIVLILFLVFCKKC